MGSKLCEIRMIRLAVIILIGSLSAVASDLRELSGSKNGCYPNQDILEVDKPTNFTCKKKQLEIILEVTQDFKKFSGRALPYSDDKFPGTRKFSDLANVSVGNGSESVDQNACLDHFINFTSFSFDSAKGKRFYTASTELKTHGSILPEDVEGLDEMADNYFMCSNDHNSTPLNPQNPKIKNLFPAVFGKDFFEPKDEQGKPLDPPKAKAYRSEKFLHFMLLNSIDNYHNVSACWDTSGLSPKDDAELKQIKSRSYSHLQFVQQEASEIARCCSNPGSNTGCRDANALHQSVVRKFKECGNDSYCREQIKSMDSLQTYSLVEKESYISGVLKVAQQILETEKKCATETGMKDNGSEISCEDLMKNLRQNADSESPTYGLALNTCNAGIPQCHCSKFVFATKSVDQPGILKSDEYVSDYRFDGSGNVFVPSIPSIYSSGPTNTAVKYTPPNFVSTTPNAGPTFTSGFNPKAYTFDPYNNIPSATKPGTWQSDTTGSPNLSIAKTPPLDAKTSESSGHAAAPTTSVQSGGSGGGGTLSPPNFPPTNPAKARFAAQKGEPKDDPFLYVPADLNNPKGPVKLVDDNNRTMGPLSALEPKTMSTIEKALKEYLIGNSDPKKGSRASSLEKTLTSLNKCVKLLAYRSDRILNNVAGAYGSCGSGTAASCYLPYGSDLINYWSYPENTSPVLECLVPLKNEKALPSSKTTTP